MIIERGITPVIKKALSGEPKIVIIYGPRQAGKTTLIHELLNAHPPADVQILNGDDFRVQEGLGEAKLDKLQGFVGNTSLLVIDEAQRIPNIGLSLKLLYDSLKLSILATGSSAFELSGKINEALTGRAVNFTLYPISVTELSVPPPASLSSRLAEFLRFGLYPKVLTLSGEKAKQDYLLDLVNNVLYKDILIFETVRKPKKLLDLLALLALQVGSEVSIAELAKHLDLSKTVVEKYLDILEKMFIVVNLRGLSRNLRKEIYKTSKYYFVDIGFRNAVIRNFNVLNLRSDTGPMFENFFFMERQKVLSNRHEFANFYFWRTYDQKEIDLIEEREGKLLAYEIKWAEGKTKLPGEFSAAYPNSHLAVVNRENFFKYL